MYHEGGFIVQDEGAQFASELAATGNREKDIRCMRSPWRKDMCFNRLHTSISGSIGLRY